jgi:hypothetical protein
VRVRSRIHFDVVLKMNADTRAPEVGGLVAVSLVILVFYPMTIAPTGPLSNGGILGFSALLVAMACSWTAFVRGRQRAVFRWLVLLPIAALIT